MLIMSAFGRKADFPVATQMRSLSECGISYAVSRRKHQPLKSIMDGQSKSEIDLMFCQQDHDAKEWVEKLRIKKVRVASVATLYRKSQED